MTVVLLFIPSTAWSGCERGVRCTLEENVSTGASALQPSCVSTPIFNSHHVYHHPLLAVFLHNEDLNSIKASRLRCEHASKTLPPVAQVFTRKSYYRCRVSKPKATKQVLQSVPVYVLLSRKVYMHTLQSSLPHFELASTFPIHIHDISGYASFRIRN